MTTTDDLSSYLADRLEGTYDCTDRITVRGYHPLGQTSGGLLTWWNQLFPNTALTEERLRKLAGDFGRRVFAIFVAKAPGLVWQAKNNREGKVVVRRPKSWPLVYHYHFHIVDPEWGHVTIRLSGHPSLGLKI